MKLARTAAGSAFLLCCLSIFLVTVGATLQDTDFWNDAAQGGMAEVALSNAALQKAQSEQVKQFAQQMVTDHTATNQELMQLASTKNVTLPTTMASKHQRNLDKLNSRSGSDFDREYMKTMVQDHERMVKLFERQSERGTDAEAKAFAAKTLPALQSHLTMARNIYDATRGRSGSDRGNSSNNNSSSDANIPDTNRRPNVRQDTNQNTNRNNNTNSNGNSNSNTNSNRSNTNRGNTNNSNMDHF